MIRIKHFGDITKLNGADLPIVDVITGGSPCQDLSVAGKRAGLDGERSGLFMEQVRIVKEMREHDRQLYGGRTDVSHRLRPRFMVWENVPGSLSSPGKGNTGKDFQAVLTEIARIAEPECPDVPMPKGGKWPHAGVLYGVGDDGQSFSVAWKLHDSQWWGVPQRRRRVSLVADFNGLTAGEILLDPQYRRETESAESDTSERDFGRGCKSEIPSERKGLSGDTEESEQTGKATSTDSERSTGESDRCGIE